MNKTKIYNYLQLGLWISTFIGLVIIIFIPKSEALYQSLYYLFIILWLIIPFILLTINAINYSIKGIKKREAFMFMPLVGLSLFTLLSVFRFIPALDKTGITYMIIASIVFLIIIVISIVLMFKVKNYQSKHHFIILIINYLLYIVFFLLSVNISYYHSLNWDY